MQLFKGEQVMALRIKNWSKHQHFKDRTPPWIKLYRDIIDDPDWHDLDGDSAKILISLWLIASEDDSHTGVLPDERRLAFRLRISEKQLKIHLNKLSNWLIRDDIETISARHQSDAPERAGEETETETETETDKQASSKLAGFDDFWSAYPRKKNKGDAEKAWKAIKPSADLLKTILEAVEVAKLGDDWRRENGRFIQYPASWLRAKGWEDERPTATVIDIDRPKPGDKRIINGAELTYYAGLGFAL